MRFYFVGDVDRSRARTMLTAGPLAALHGEPTTSRPGAASRAPDTAPTQRTVIVSQPSARHTVLACGRLARLPSQRAVAALEAAVSVLAGWNGSRLHVRLRECAGMSYWVSADFAARRHGDCYQCEIKISTAVAPGDVALALTLIRAELGRLASGQLGEEELRQSIGWMVHSQKLYLQTPDQMAALHAHYVERGLTAGFGQERAALLTDLAAAEVTAAAANHLTTGLLTLAAVGDASILEAPLAGWASGGDDGG